MIWMVWLMGMMMLLIFVCRCNYQEDQKNQKIPVGYGLISRDQCVIHHNPYFLARRRKNSTRFCEHPITSVTLWLSTLSTRYGIPNNFLSQHVFLSARLLSLRVSCFQHFSNLIHHRVECN